MTTLESLASASTASRIVMQPRTMFALLARRSGISTLPYRGRRRGALFRGITLRERPAEADDPTPHHHKEDIGEQIQGRDGNGERQPGPRGQRRGARGVQHEQRSHERDPEVAPPSPSRSSAAMRTRSSAKSAMNATTKIIMPSDRAPVRARAGEPRNERVERAALEALHRPSPVAVFASHGT